MYWLKLNMLQKQHTPSFLIRLVIGEKFDGSRIAAPSNGSATPCLSYTEGSIKEGEEELYQLRHLTAHNLKAQSDTQHVDTVKALAQQRQPATRSAGEVSVQAANQGQCAGQANGDYRLLEETPMNAQ